MVTCLCVILSSLSLVVPKEAWVKDVWNVSKGGVLDLLEL